MSKWDGAIVKTVRPRALVCCLTVGCRPFEGDVGPIVGGWMTLPGELFPGTADCVATFLEAPPCFCFLTDVLLSTTWFCCVANRKTKNADHEPKAGAAKASPARQRLRATKRRKLPKADCDERGRFIGEPWRGTGGLREIRPSYDS